MAKQWINEFSGAMMAQEGPRLKGCVVGRYLKFDIAQRRKKKDEKRERRKSMKRSPEKVQEGGAEQSCALTRQWATKRYGGH